MRTFPSHLHLKNNYHQQKQEPDYQKGFEYILKYFRLSPLSLFFRTAI